jgi:2-(1,2-epoxy-1,2-dihydrophenyl)acetyl-CoA isomerase
MRNKQAQVTKKMQSTDIADAPLVSSIEDNVGTITLNRPDAMNAFNVNMAKQLIDMLAEFGRDDSVRAIVLMGAGRVFSAGGDIREMLRDVRGGEDRAAYFKVPLSAFGEAVVALREIVKPVLAAVHGAVAGVAFNLMLACDLKVATDTTHFTQGFIRIGLSPDGGGTWFLPRFVGYARACELALLPSGIDAATAQEWGLVNWVVAEEDFAESVRGIAGRLARNPAGAMARTKFLLNSAHDRDLTAQIEAERLAQIENAASPDFEEGLAAFLEKRHPRFGR